MSITGLSGNYYQLLRLSPFLLDPVLASGAGHTPDRQPPVLSSVQVKAGAAGTVLVSGLVEAAATSETLTFSAAGYRSTARRFSSISSLTPAGALVGQMLEAKAVGADGSPQTKMLSAVATGWPGAFTPGAPHWARRREIQSEKREAMIAFDYRADIDPRRDDFLVDESTGERWFIRGVNLFPGRFRLHHWEVHVTLWDGEPLG